MKRIAPGGLKPLLRRSRRGALKYHHHTVERRVPSQPYPAK
jgi:hypothetical protein